MSMVEAEAAFANPLSPLLDEYAVQNPHNISAFIDNEIRSSNEGLHRQLLSRSIESVTDISEILVDEFSKRTVLPLQLAATVVKLGIEGNPMFEGFTNEDVRRFLDMAADASLVRLRENYSYPKWVPTHKRSVSLMSMVGQSLTGEGKNKTVIVQDKHTQKIELFKEKLMQRVAPTASGAERI